jgi:hypothetical protein
MIVSVLIEQATVATVVNYNHNTFIVPVTAFRSAFRFARHASGLAREEPSVARTFRRSQRDDRKRPCHRHTVLYGLPRESKHQRLLGEEGFAISSQSTK